MSRAAVMIVALLLVVPATAIPVTGAETVTVTVALTDQAGNSVGDADLTATWNDGSKTVTTAGNGKAFVDVPKGAKVTIEVSHPEYVRNNPYVIEEATEEETQIPVYERGSLSVDVSNENGPIENARVVVRKHGKIADHGRTNADGGYASGAIEQGEYSVTVVKSGYYHNRTEVSVSGSESQQISIERGSVTLKVTVTDPHFSTPKPVEKARISIQSIGEFTTLADGTATVGVPVNSELDLAVTKDGHEKTTRSVEVKESKLTTEVAISRQPSISLESVNNRVVAGERVVVHVTDEYDDPVVGATVVRNGNEVGETGESGELAILINETGEHTLVANAENLSSSKVTVEAISAERATQTSSEATTSSEQLTVPEQLGVNSPGFTPLSAVVAVLALSVLALRSRR